MPTDPRGGRPPAPVSASTSLVRALGLTLRSTRWLFLGAVCTQIIVSSSFALVLALTKVLVDRVVYAGSRAAVVSVIIGLVVVVVVQRLAGLAMSSLMTLAADRASAAAVTRYLTVAAKLDAGHLDDPGFHDRMRDAGEAADSRFQAIVRRLVAFPVGSAARSPWLPYWRPSHHSSRSSSSRRSCRGWLPSNAGSGS